MPPQQLFFLIMQETKDTTLWDLIKSTCRWLGRVCVDFGHFLAKQIKISFRKWYIVFPITIIGIVLGLWYSRVDNRKYKAEGMAAIHGPMAAEIKEVVRPISMALSPRVQPELSLSEILDCSPECTMGISRLRTIYVVDYQNNITPDLIDYKDKHQLEDTLNLISNNYIVFELYTKNLANLRNFESALANYVNTNAIMQTKYHYHHSMLEDELDICNRQLNYLDSLSKVLYFNFPQADQVDLKYDPKKAGSLIVGKRSVELLHDEILSLNQHKKGVEADLASCTEPLVFISHISPMPKAVNNRIKCLIISFLFGWVAGLCCAWLFEDRKQVCDWLKNK